MHYRVHSRQMLCIGGSQIPFGWSFLSIAKVPMTWGEGDIWTAEVQPCARFCLRPSPESLSAALLFALSTRPVALSARPLDRLAG